MKFCISHPTKKLIGTIELTTSKSESNRALIIQALCSEPFEIKGLADADDTKVMVSILQSAKTYNQQENIYDVGAAGTAMRFLTAYFSTLEGTRIITGTDRMKKRPIGILVNALRELGASIDYLEEEGFPPLKINGRTLKGGEIEMNGNVSSQFISALLLISPKLQDGLVIKFNGAVTSRPYVKMTLNMLKEFNVHAQWRDNFISVDKQGYQIKNESGYTYKIEADWSAASYWYGMVALSKEADFKIMGLLNSSLQGDSIVADLFTFLGVKTEYIENGIRLTKTRIKDEHFGFNFSDCPDLAQTIAVVASALKIPAFFNGLHTLQIKETDRVGALKKELKKLGTEIEILNESCINIKYEDFLIDKITEPISISTYEDHRMAMAFSMLAIHDLNSICIEHPEVVKKSYPDFWKDFKKVGFEIKEMI